MIRSPPSEPQELYRLCPKRLRRPTSPAGIAPLAPVWLSPISQRPWMPTSLQPETACHLRRDCVHIFAVGINAQSRFHIEAPPLLVQFAKLLGTLPQRTNRRFSRASPQQFFHRRIEEDRMRLRFFNQRGITRLDESASAQRHHAHRRNQLSQ